MSKVATKKFGKVKVIVEYYDDCNSIHLECLQGGKLYTADISELVSQRCEGKPSKWLRDDQDNFDCEVPAGTWERIDTWLTNEDHY